MTFDPPAPIRTVVLLHGSLAVGRSTRQRLTSRRHRSSLQVGRESPRLFLRGFLTRIFPILMWLSSFPNGTQTGQSHMLALVLDKLPIAVHGSAAYPSPSTVHCSFVPFRVLFLCPSLARYKDLCVTARHSVRAMIQSLMGPLRRWSPRSSTRAIAKCLGIDNEDTTLDQNHRKGCGRGRISFVNYSRCKPKRRT